MGRGPGVALGLVLGAALALWLGGGSVEVWTVSLLAGLVGATLLGAAMRAIRRPPPETPPGKGKETEPDG